MSLPQRGNQPSLDLTPDATPDTAAWDEEYDDPMNPLNKPAPLRSGPPDVNGWTRANYPDPKMLGVKET